MLDFARAFVSKMETMLEERQVLGDKGRTANHSERPSPPYDRDGVEHSEQPKQRSICLGLGVRR
jgi:hypothetical protein